MIKLGLLLFSLFSIVACSTYQVDSKEYRDKFSQSKTFNYPKDKCFKAAVAALEEREYKVKSSDIAKGTIETDKRKFSVNATVSSNGGRNVSMAQLQQADKHWIQVTAVGNSCQISFTKSRLWNGEEELEKVQGGGGDWAKEHIHDAFYKEVEGKLSSN